jgi:O-acetyl-ADP-ribose deacetylase (regulator of RNase III)
LAHGGGVAAAISRKGGPTIQEESNTWVRQHGPVTHARPAFTSGGKMPCRYVIHAVGPVWGEGDERRKLADAIRGSLALADQLKLESIAFPAISTGIFGFPKDLASAIFMESIPAYFSAHTASGLKVVKIVLYDSPTLSVFSDAFRKTFEQD